MLFFVEQLKSHIMDAKQIIDLLNKSRRIGEQFNYGEVTLEVTESNNVKSCCDCYFLNNWCAESFDTRGKCSKRARDDKRDVYFKEV